MEPPPAGSPSSDVILVHRGRAIRAGDIAFVRSLIAAHPDSSRRALSKLLCEAWSWRQENGSLRDMVCRGLMLALYRAGHIELPAVRHRPPNPLGARRSATRSAQLDLFLDRGPLRASLEDITPLEFRVVRRTADEPLLRALLAEHHYLGYMRPVGEQLEYLVYARGIGAGRPVAALAWSSPPRHLGPRDRFIGWSAPARRRNLRFIAYNTRYLILPWVEVRHLASHILGRLARRISRDWERAYGHPLHFLETFTDPSRFRGTCYLAANWIAVGRTTGRGHNAPTKKPRVALKEILCYPLTRRFGEILGGEA